MKMKMILYFSTSHMKLRNSKTYMRVQKKIKLRVQHAYPVIPNFGHQSSITRI